MGESIYTAINIRTPGSWGHDEDNPPWFIQWIVDDMYDFTIADPEVRPDGTVSWNLTGMLNYGTASEPTSSMLDLMRECRIPFDCNQEGGPDWPGEYELFDGNTSVSAETDGSNVVLDYNTWNRILKIHTSGLDDVVDDYGVVTTVVKWWDTRLRQLDDIPVDHLPPWPPPKEVDIATSARGTRPLKLLTGTVWL